MATGGGGYQWARVVPRAWTIAFAEMADAELPDELPEAWIEQAEFVIRGEVPRRSRSPRWVRATATTEPARSRPRCALVGLEGPA